MIADLLLAVEAILFRWLYLISLVVLSNIGSGSNFSTSKLLFVLSRSRFSSKDVIADRLMVA